MRETAKVGKGDSIQTAKVGKGDSIQTRLIGMVAVTLAVTLLVNLFIYRQISSMVRTIDSVFASNVTISELTEELGLLQGHVYEYLNTKSSEALEEYYRSVQEYHALIEQLNGKRMDSEIKLLEKNIRNMSERYLEIADATVQAKRGRNVERYKELYTRQEDLFHYINMHIEKLNSLQFDRNSRNYQFLLSAMRILELLSLGVIVALYFFCLIFIAVVIRTMIHPLTILSAAATRVADGDFLVNIPAAATGDEIGVVTNTFRQMLESIRAYIERLRTSMESQARMKQNELAMEANLKEAQLKFLQAQINPHFLFNSLNAGAQLAMMEEADGTGEFLEKMADFFRYTIKNTDGSSTLEEEIASVDNYIYILNVRFAGDILYRKQISGEPRNWRMPGMILQPIVENAVTHGIRDMIDRGIITLSVEVEEDQVRVTVSDNGEGMTREQIALVSSGDYHSEQENGSTGIGLANVRNRLMLYYDQEDLLSIHSDGKGLGTEVTVVLPRVGPAGDAGQEEKSAVPEPDAGQRESAVPEPDAGQE